jgi:hypothetical protein
MPLEYEMMEGPIDEMPDVESPGCLRNLEFGWSFHNPACDIQSQGLADSGQGTSEGHATRGVADQTPESL